MRTCVGCRRSDERDNLVRAVLADAGGVAFDLREHAPGRGAWVHPRTGCLQAAARGGFARGFKVAIRMAPADVVVALRVAADHHVQSLLAAAREAGVLAVGEHALGSVGPGGRGSLVVLAADAGAVAHAPAVQEAASRGRVVLWGTKKILGAAAARDEAAAVALCHAGLADAVARAIALSQMPAPDARKSGREYVPVEVR